MELMNADLNFKRDSFSLNAKLQMGDSEIVSLIGPSGSGKSTLLRLLAGLDQPDSGYIEILGETWFDGSSGYSLHPSQRSLAMVFQDFALFQFMTVEQNVAYAANDKKQVSYWLKRLKIDKIARRYPREISGGEQQRTAIARALVRNTKILLLDEPFSALDSDLRVEIREQLKDIIEDLSVTVLMVTHDLHEALYLSDRIGVIHEGSLLAYRDRHSLCKHPRIKQVAEILGWRNFLPVDYITDSRTAGGSWGRARVSQPFQFPASHLCIRPEHICITNKTDAHPAIINRITDVGSYRIVDAALLNGSKLTIHCPWNELLAIKGNTVGLEFPQHLLHAVADKSVVLTNPTLYRDFTDNMYSTPIEFMEHC